MKKITKFLIVVFTALCIALLCTACKPDATPDDNGGQITPGGETGGETGGENSGETGGDNTENNTGNNENTGDNTGDNKNPTDEATIRKNAIAAAIEKSYDNDTVKITHSAEGVSVTNTYKNDGNFSYLKWDRGNGNDFFEYVYEFDEDGYLKMKYFKNNENKWVISDDPEYYVNVIDLSEFTADDFRYFEGKYFLSADKIEKAMAYIFNVSSVTYVPDEVTITLDENNVIKTVYAKAIEEGVEEENVFVMELSDVGSTEVTTPDYENVVNVTHTDKTVTVGESIAVVTLFSITEQGEAKVVKEEMIDKDNLNLNVIGVYNVKITYVARDGKVYNDTATVTVSAAETDEHLTFAQIYANAKSSANITFTVSNGSYYKQVGDTVVIESTNAATMYVFYKDGVRKAVNGNTLYLNENYKAAVPNIKEITDIGASEFSTTEESNVYVAENSAAVADFIKKYAPQFADRINEENCSVKIKTANNKITEITVSYEYKMTANAKDYTAKTDVYTVSDCGTTVINVPDGVTANAKVDK